MSWPSEVEALYDVYRQQIAEIEERDAMLLAREDTQTSLAGSTGSVQSRVRGYDLILVLVETDVDGTSSSSLSFRSTFYLSSPLLPAILNGLVADWLSPLPDQNCSCFLGLGACWIKPPFDCPQGYSM